MRRPFSPLLLAEIASAVQATIARTQIVNISMLARDIQSRNAAENVALEDIEYALLGHAQRLGGVVEFADDEGIVPLHISTEPNDARNGRNLVEGEAFMLTPLLKSN